jgi:hypothetical protein
LLIGNDFIPEIRENSVHCSECNKKIRKGELCLVSIKKGKVQKRVCGEDCRLDFDARFWEIAAKVNNKRRYVSTKGKR